MARIDNKTALVVGGAKGIGLAVAERLSAEGATVFLTGRRDDEVKAAVLNLSGDVHGLVADAGVPEDLERIVATVVEARGRLDYLVLNAGLSEPSTILDETPEHFDRHFGCLLYTSPSPRD